MSPQRARHIVNVVDMMEEMLEIMKTMKIQMDAYEEDYRRNPNTSNDESNEK